MTNNEKRMLLDLALELNDKGVKISMEFSVHGMVTITIWSNSEQYHLEYQVSIKSSSCIDKKIKCVRTFIKDRAKMKSKYEVA